MFTERELDDLREANESREGGPRKRRLAMSWDREIAMEAFHRMDPEQDEALYVRTVRNFPAELLDYKAKHPA